MKMHKNPYNRFGRKLKLEEVLPFIPSETGVFLNQQVKLESLRLICFAKKGTCCSDCGLEAKFFALEKMKNDKENVRYHLNMYGYDRHQREVLFTHDHTLARSLGGKDHLDNVTTMCGPCNWKKGVQEDPNRTPVVRKTTFDKLKIVHKKSVGKYIKLFLDLENNQLVIKTPATKTFDEIKFYKKICRNFIADNSNVIADDNFHGDIYINPENIIQVRLNSKSESQKLIEKYKIESLSIE